MELLFFFNFDATMKVLLDNKFIIKHSLGYYQFIYFHFFLILQHIQYLHMNITSSSICPKFDVLNNVLST